MLEEFLHTGKEQEKAEWLGAAWHLKMMFDKGLMKGFDKDDFNKLKFSNVNYNRAREHKYKADAFNYWMFGDAAAAKISDKAFELCKDIYNKHIKQFAR